MSSIIHTKCTKHFTQRYACVSMIKTLQKKQNAYVFSQSSLYGKQKRHAGIIYGIRNTWHAAPPRPCSKGTLILHTKTRQSTKRSKSGKNPRNGGFYAQDRIVLRRMPSSELLKVCLDSIAFLNSTACRQINSRAGEFQTQLQTSQYRKICCCRRTASYPRRGRI